jgi:hypothetical protein
MGALKDEKRSVIPFVKKEIEILHIVSLDRGKRHSSYHGAKIVLDATA